MHEDIGPDGPSPYRIMRLLNGRKALFYKDRQVSKGFRRMQLSQTELPDGCAVRCDRNWFSVAGPRIVGRGYDAIDGLGCIYARVKIVFRGRREGKWYLVVDGEEIGAGYPHIQSEMEIDRKNILFIAAEAPTRNEFAVLNGKPASEVFDRIGANWYLVRGKILLAGEKDGLHRVYFDGKFIAGAFADIDDIQPSKDGTSVRIRMKRTKESEFDTIQIPLAA